jgi:hypothetical protein
MRTPVCTRSTMCFSSAVMMVPMYQGTTTVASQSFGLSSGRPVNARIVGNPEVMGVIGSPGCFFKKSINA